MKFIVALCLFGVAVALPQRHRFSSSIPHQPVSHQPVSQARANANPERFASTLRHNSVAPVGGSFSYDFETENGISHQSEGIPGAHGQANVAGGFSYTLDDGTLAQISYVADEFGFRPVGDILPQPHPLPPHAVEQIRIAEEQKARGIVFN